jgi:hypothetical protein
MIFDLGLKSDLNVLNGERVNKALGADEEDGDEVAIALKKFGVVEDGDFGEGVREFDGEGVKIVFGVLAEVTTGFGVEGEGEHKVRAIRHYGGLWPELPLLGQNLGQVFE